MGKTGDNGIVSEMARWRDVADRATKVFEKGLKTTKATSEHASRRAMDRPNPAVMPNQHGGQMINNSAILSSGMHLNSALGDSLVDPSVGLDYRYH